MGAASRAVAVGFFVVVGFLLFGLALFLVGDRKRLFEKSFVCYAEFERVADQIRAEAYNLFKHRGARDGHALDDWLAAEREFCWPAAELTEANGGYSLKVALAGFDPKEIEVTADLGPDEICEKYRNAY